MNAPPSQTISPHRPALLAAFLVVAVTALYLLAVHALAPAIAAGAIPFLSEVAASRGYGVETFRDLTERLFIAFGLAVAVLGILAALRRGWLTLNDPDAFASHAIAIITAVVAAVFILNAFHGPITFRGDANDYLLMNVSMSSNGTPELRAADIERYTELRIEAGVAAQNPYDGYFLSPVNGARYCWHFWLYPAVAAPAHIALDAIGVSPLRAYEITNVLMFLLAMHAIARLSRLTPHQKMLFAGLFVMSPVAWYMSWPSAEVFTAALVVVAISLFTARRHEWGVFAAGLAATMNPSLIVVVAVLAAYALSQAESGTRVRAAVRLAGASAVSFAAVIFNFALFGAGNLIQRAGMASASFITPEKVVDFFLSFDQGLFPYVPIVLVFAGGALVWAVKNRDWWTFVRFAAVLVVVTATATTIEWNSDAVGMRRHAVWIFPLLLWLAVETVPRPTRKALYAVTVALLVQFTVFVLWVYPPGMGEHSALCDFALEHAPGLYSPLPGVFAPRSNHLTIPLAEEVPVVYDSRDGVREVLTDDAHLKALDLYLDLSPKARVRAADPRPAGDGLLYVAFDPDTASLRTQNTPLLGRSFPIRTILGGPSQFGHEFDAFNELGPSEDGLPEAAPLTYCALYVRLRNTGAEPWYPSGEFPVGVLVDVTDARGATVSHGPIPLARAVMPGEDTAFYAHFLTPTQTGHVRVTAAFAQKDGDGSFERLATDEQVHIVSVVTVPAAP